MNTYPRWKYFVLLLVLVVSVIYALPNLYAPDPSVQIIRASGGSNISESVATRAVTALDKAGIDYFGEELSEDAKRILIRVNSNEDQLLAKSAIQAALGDNYVVALNLAPNTPKWLGDLGGKPMKLGLDLSGGVHFLLEVDIDAAVEARLESAGGELRSEMREQGIRYRNIEVRDDLVLEIELRNETHFQNALAVARERLPAPQHEIVSLDDSLTIEIRFSVVEVREIEEKALQQNLTALKNRVNELGVAEPLVQRQGRKHIVVELPGIQDTAGAKRILGKTANLEFRLEYDPSKGGLYEEYPHKEPAGLVSRLERKIIVTGELVTDASTGYDESGRPQVNIKLSGAGGDRMHRATRESVGRRMAVLFIEYKGKTVPKLDDTGRPVFDSEGNPETTIEQYAEKKIISLATIQSPLGVSFRITGVGSQYEANELSLLLRAGALAAPMVFVEERTVGPSLGAENIAAGINSLQIGMLLVMLFMIVYYRAFGVIANMSLLANLVILTAAMSIIGATLTLPGIAGIVLTLGMAVDANVLIFSRIREELKNGVPIQSSIQAGYDRAWATILDANLTTLIVALILYLIGSGPIKGFAVTLFIGILTSMFTAVMGSRALVNVAIGGRRVEKLWI